MRIDICLSALFLLCSSATSLAQQAKLEGHVFDDQNRPASGARIIASGGQAGVTDNRGHFSIPFPASIQPGQATRIEVVRTSWVIYQPMSGNCVTQSTERNYEPLRVVIVPKGSPLALSPKRLSQVIAQWSAERVRLRTAVGTLKQSADEYAFLRQYAKEYGFTLEQFHDAAQQWAQIKDSDDQEERALKEYWRKNYERAAQLAEESAKVADEELKQANQKTIAASLKVIRRYTLAGNAYYAEYKFREALNAYNEIEKRFETRELSKDTLIAEWAILRFLIGDAKVARGERVEGEEGPRLLREALAEYQQVGSFYTREQSPQIWALTQGSLGNVLTSLGDRVSGTESFRYLNEAVAAHRAALKVCSREESPEDWAAIQNNLGIALVSLGERASLADGLTYLNGAVAAFRFALEVKTRELLPQEWAATQNNLGLVLFRLGERARGAEGLKYLNEAVSAYRVALEVRTREQSPAEWAETQNNLGGALVKLSERVESAESVEYLNKAIAALRAALDGKLREQSPQYWARAQNNLGAALMRLGERSHGATSIQYLMEAVAASRSALEVMTREQLPQDWAETQNNLAVIYIDLSARVDEAERVKYPNDAMTTLRAVLEVRTREQLPQHWAATQLNLAIAYFQLRDWSGAAEASASVLNLDPNNREAYGIAALLNHDRLFNFDKAFVLNQQWLAIHPEDTSAQADFAEAHFTLGQYAECVRRINPLLNMPEVSVSIKTALRTIEIASLLGDNRASQVPAKLDALIAEVTRQPVAFKVQWGFDGTRHFIDQTEKLSAYRAWLDQLFDALASQDRDSMLTALRSVQVRFIVRVGLTNGGYAPPLLRTSSERHPSTDDSAVGVVDSPRYFRSQASALGVPRIYSSYAETCKEILTLCPNKISLNDRTTLVSC